MALTFMLPCGNITPLFESIQVNYSRTGTIVIFGAEKRGLFPFGNVAMVNPPKTSIPVWFLWLPRFVLRRCRGLLAWTLRDLLLFPFANGQVSGERPRVDFEALSRFPTHLPPVAEQERIVAKLNVVSTKVRRAEMAAYRALGRLKHYRASVLNAAVTGELTRDWRKKAQKSDETGTQLLTGC
jgi:hypothetical protein